MQAESWDYPGWGQPLYGGVVYTADDVERMPDDGYRYEVYRGVLLRMPGNGITHGLICQFIGRILEDYWRARGERFRVVQNVGFDFTFPGDVRKSTMLVPDVAVMSDKEHLGPQIAQHPPLIAVEVISPTETRKEVHNKARFYLANEVAEVWCIRPKKRTVEVWQAPNTTTLYSDQQTMTSVQLPGWSCLVSTFFDG